MRTTAALAFILLMLPAPALAATPGPAKVLVLGNPPNIRVVASWLARDPMTDPTQVPCRTHLTNLQGADIQRFIRLYFPRNYQKLLEYDYLMLIMVEVDYLTQEQQYMLYNAMYKDGKGGLQDRSVMSMAEYIAHPWARSIISDAFPNDADKVVSQMKWSYEVMTLRFVINTNPQVPPVLSPYKDLEGVEAVLSPGTTCIAIPKEGAVVTSYVIGDFPQSWGGSLPDPRVKGRGWMPHTMYWKYGNATTWTHHDMLGGDAYWQPSRNPYSIDMILAEMMFATGRDLPKDVVLVHQLRQRFANYDAARGFIYSLLDFIDKFGASGTPIISKAQAISGVAGQGENEYLAQEYEAAFASMEKAISQMEALRSEAMRLKDRALIWVYVTEWLAVSGVSLLAGFAVWSLMVRRRLYREVAVTRLAQFG